MSDNPHVPIDLDNLPATALRALQRRQEHFDSTHYHGPADETAHWKHILAHTMITTGRLARVSERRDHSLDCEASAVGIAIADLLIHALQFASLERLDLGSLYHDRLAELEDRRTHAR